MQNNESDKGSKETSVVPFKRNYIGNGRSYIAAYGGDIPNSAIREIQELTGRDIESMSKESIDSNLSFIGYFN